MTVTMREVAQKANVSIKTVSRVVNDQGEISETTRQRVMQVIAELGYRPNKVAQGLVTQRTYVVGLAVGDITNPFFPEIARGVMDTARENGYNVFLCNTDGNLQRELQTLLSLADHAVDGIILYPSYDSDQNLRTFAAQYRPLVVVNYFFEHPGVSQLMVDNYHGARLAVNHLLDKGHRTIGMLSGVLKPHPTRVRRIQGFQDALVERGLPIEGELIVPSQDPTFESGHEAARRLLTGFPQVTAIFAYNDLLALGAIKACRELGRRIPEDCAIVGFDDIQWAATATPALTTVRVDKYELGRQTVFRLLAMLDNPEATYPALNFGVDLVVREST